MKVRHEVVQHRTGMLMTQSLPPQQSRTPKELLILYTDLILTNNWTNDPVGWCEWVSGWNIYKLFQKEVNYNGVVLAAERGDDADVSVWDTLWWRKEKKKKITLSNVIVHIDIIAFHILECGMILLVRYWIWILDKCMWYFIMHLVFVQ